MKQAGLALVELMLVVGVIMAVSAGIAAFAWHVDDTEYVDRAANELGTLLEAIDTSDGRVMGHFSGISAQRVADQELAPAGMLADGTLRSRWGAIELEPLTVDPSRPHSAVRMTYQGIPQKVCFPLVKAIEKVADAVKVNGVAVFDQHRLNLTTLGTACQSATEATIVLDHDSHGGGDPALL